MVSNPTNIDVDSRGRVWVTEGLNYRLTRGGNRRFQPDRGGRPDQDPRGHRRRRQGRQGHRLRRPDLPRPDGHGRRGALRQGRQVPRLPRLRRQQPRPARARGHRRRRQGRQALPAPDRLRRGRLRPRRARHGRSASTASSTSPTATAAARSSTTTPSGQQNFDVVDKSGRHVWSDQLANTLRVNRDGTQFEIICDRQRNNYETSLNSFGNIFTSDNDDDGNRGCRVIWVMDGGHYGYRTPGSPRHWGEEVPGNVPKLVGTGNGSPCGIMVYEGELLPAEYRGARPRGRRRHPPGQLLPDRPPRGRVPDRLQGLPRQRRPVVPARRCLTAAPDGSVFVADWYDAGVGGHAFSDQTTGRIYRVAPKGHKSTKPEARLRHASTA